MKKHITVLLSLALVLFMFVTAFAAETKGTQTTTVSLTLDPTMESYTLTIPSTVTIDPVSKTGEVSVSLADVTLVWHSNLDVYVTAENQDVEGTGSYLVNTENETQKIHYQINSEESGSNLTGNSKMKVAYYHSGEGSSLVGKEVYGDLNLVVDGEYSSSGTFTDILTFTVELT